MTEELVMGLMDIDDMLERIKRVHKSAQRLSDIATKARQERDEARRWSAAWKRAAKECRRAYRITHNRAVETTLQLDEARAKLVTNAAAVTDAAKGREEAERELREALAELDAVRERNEALEATLRMYADKTMWSDSASERMEPDGPWGHDGSMDWTAEVELPFDSLFDGFDGDGWQLAAEVLKELEEDGNE